MTKRFLLSILMGCIATVTMYAASSGFSGVSQQKGVRLSQKQIETIRAVHPWMGSQSQSKKPKTTKARLSRLNTQHSAMRSPNKINSSGSSIQGWKICDGYGAVPSGWYEVDYDGTQTFKWDYHNPDWIDDGWSEEPQFPFNTGFYRNGKVYGFHAEMILYWLVWGHGAFSIDGNIEEYEQYGDYFDVTDFSTYVISCAYDSDQDVVYAYTLNADASEYMLQKVDPDTWDFTEIRSSVGIEDVLLGLAYNPVDKRIYGITPDSRFVTLDTDSGSLSQVAKFGLPLSTSTQGMVYSPLDKAFVVIVPSENDCCDLYTVDPQNPELVKRTVLTDALQYCILITPDVMAEAATPLTAEIQSVEFNDGDSDGKAFVLLPKKTFGGEELAGIIELVAKVDGEEYANVHGNPGEVVEVGFKSIKEGLHRFSFYVKANGLESAEVDQNLYVGYDTPVAPDNIHLESGLLTWNPVTESIHNGYLDLAHLSYNVYLNGERLNSDPIVGTSYDFTMPEAVYQAYVAQVEAVNHGHISEKGFSNDIKHGNPFPLPFTVAPTRQEAELVKVEADRYEMLTWHGEFYDDVKTGTFACSTFNYNNADNVKEWLWLPAMTIPSLGNLLEISFEVQCYRYDEEVENLGVALSASQDSADAVIIKQWEGLQNEEWVRFSVYCFPEPGANHVGFFTVSNPDGRIIRIRNISVNESALPTSTPAEVSNLAAQALPQGALKAKVEFDLPRVDASGGTISDESLNAIVSSAIDEVIVAGCPGDHISAEVATEDGLNEITVVAANASHGLEAKTTVFTGVDVPGPITVCTAVHTSDYKELHIEWEAPEAGANGGYVDPTNVSYALCLYDEEEYEWNVVEDLGNVTSYDVSFRVDEGIVMAELGLLAFNDKGNCGTLRIVGGAVGTPYTLPMYEKFGSQYDHAYSPMVGESPSDEYPEGVGWGYCVTYPYWIDMPSPYGDSSYVMQSSAGANGRVVLPAFSTEGLDKAGIELPLYGKKGCNEIHVLGRAYGVEPILLGVYEGTDEPEWQKKRFHLPAQLLGKEWVEILIDGVFTSAEETIASFGQYAICAFVDEDLAVTSLSAPVFPLIGESTEVTAVIENKGLKEIAAPDVDLTVAKDGKVIKSMTMERTDGSGLLGELEEASYRFSWTPDAETYGEVELCVRLSGCDMDVSNDEKTTEATVGRAKAAVVTDLAAEVTDNGVILSWTDPDVATGTEGFESYSPYYYGERIGDFKTVCLDGYQSLYFIFDFPFGLEEKAWQVMSEKDITERMEAADWANTLFNACSGDRFLIAVVPLSYYIGEGLQADRWLISPEIKSGSDLSFMIAAPGGRFETFDVLYSSTDDDPGSFSIIESPSVLSDGWKEFSFTLPEDARYFAIRYAGNTDDHQYILLDDIHYVPLEDSPVLEGYDIYRDDVLIEECTKNHGAYVDTDNDEKQTSRYNVVPVVRADGGLYRGMMSNTALVVPSGVVKVESSLDADAQYYTLQGIRIENPSKGLYVKKKGNKAIKVILK